MLGAIGGVEGAVWYRPVERAAPVGSRAAEPRSEPAVSDAEGRPLTSQQPSLETLSREKRILLAQLRGELAVKQRDLIQSAGGSTASAPCEDCEEETAEGLSEDEQAEVEALRSVDQRVRAHEQAHAAVGGEFAGAPSYQYEIGPDGRAYAVGGEVKIDATPIAGDPEATAEKMRVVERAALAPSDPSPQDLKVASAARTQAQAAEADAATQSGAERRGEAEQGYQNGRSATSDAPPPILAIAA